MNAVSVYRYYQDTRLRIRNHVMPFFPKDMVTMKSGSGFHESCNEVFVKANSEGLVKTKKYSKEEADQKVPPPFWEYTKAPWYFGLAVKKFHRDPQLAMEVANVMTDKTNLPISRAEMKRQAQIAGVQNDSTATGAATYTVPTARASSDSSSVGGISSVEVVSSVEQKQLLWAKVTASKALKENTNIAKRMGKMEELT